jgi:membrane protein YdbS with pleckstrin-like domain
MNQRAVNLAEGVYARVWRILTVLFKVPRQPPHLPVAEGEQTDSFRPAQGFLQYLKLQFWILLVLIDVLILVFWIGITVAVPVVGIILAIPALILAVVPDIVAYVAIHLRYDTTWYVVSPRSLRIRRGIWVIHETTITFENVQNVAVRQGPLQRWFGISNLLVETAGGGGASPHEGTTNAHRGLIEGVANADQIRDLLLARLSRSRRAGLGDEGEEQATHGCAAAWTSEHKRVLRDIRDSLRAFVSVS